MQLSSHVVEESMETSESFHNISMVFKFFCFRIFEFNRVFLITVSVRHRALVCYHIRFFTRQENVKQLSPRYK